MLNTTHPIIKHKSGLLNQAEEPGNVSKVGLRKNRLFISGSEVVLSGRVITVKCSITGSVNRNKKWKKTASRLLMFRSRF